MTIPARFLLFDPVGNAWPVVRLPQVAFAGRSNVGKSSLLNALVGQSRLARVSNTPGRTRGIALFEVEGRFAFADLPGYGFAKVSRSEREAWKGLVEGYLEGCESLRRVYRAGGRAARPGGGRAATGGVPCGAGGAVPMGGDEGGQALRPREGGGGRPVRRRAVACRRRTGAADVRADEGGDRPALARRPGRFFRLIPVG